MTATKVRVGNKYVHIIQKYSEITEFQILIFEELGEKIEGEVDEYGMLKSLMNETRKQKRRKKRIQFFYVTTLFLRTGFEAVFIWLQYLLYGFSVPERYACQRYLTNLVFLMCFSRLR